MMRNTQYNCKLGKGCGLIEETLSLLEIYQDGMTIDALLEYVHQSNTLSKCTELRTKDIVKLVFYPRLMSRNPKVPIWLKRNSKQRTAITSFQTITTAVLRQRKCCNI